MRPSRTRRFKQRKTKLNKRKTKSCKKCKKSSKMCKKNKCKSAKRRRRRRIKKGGNPFSILTEANHELTNSVGKLYDTAMGNKNTYPSAYPTTRLTN